MNNNTDKNLRRHTDKKIKEYFFGYCGYLFDDVQKYPDKYKNLQYTFALKKVYRRKTFREWLRCFFCKKHNGKKHRAVKIGEAINDALFKSDMNTYEQRWFCVDCGEEGVHEFESEF